MNKIADIVKREEWGACQPKTKQKLPAPAATVVVTWTDTDRCETKEECLKIIKEIQKKQMDEEGLPDIKYNFLVGDDEQVYEGRGWDVGTTVSTGYRGYYTELDGKCILIAYIGPKGGLATNGMLLSLFGIRNLGLLLKSLDEKVQFITLAEGDPKNFFIDFAEIIKPPEVIYRTNDFGWYYKD